MSEWIRVDDRLPPSDMEVWVYDPVSDVVSIALYNGCYWTQSGFWVFRENEVTHWMPLDCPTPPEEEREA